MSSGISGGWGSRALRSTWGGRAPHRPAELRPDSVPALAEGLVSIRAGRAPAAAVGTRPRHRLHWFPAHESPRSSREARRPASPGRGGDFNASLGQSSPSKGPGSHPVRERAFAGVLTACAWRFLTPRAYGDQRRGGAGMRVAVFTEPHDRWPSPRGMTSPGTLDAWILYEASQLLHGGSNVFKKRQ